MVLDKLLDRTYFIENNIEFIDKKKILFFINKFQLSGHRHN